MSAKDVKCKCDCHTKLKRWERFLEAAHGEKDWMNERLNWMFVPQGVLFAALGLIMKLSNEKTKDVSEKVAQATIVQLDYLAAMISALGATLALIGFVGAVAAGRMHYLWTTEINKLAKSLNENDPTHPLVSFGMEPHWPARTSSVMPSAVTFAFIFAWAFFIYKYFDEKKILNTEIAVILLVAALLVAFIIGVIICRGNKALSGSQPEG